MPKSQYIPIDCNFHDRLLSWATLRTKCHMLLRTVSGETVAIHGILMDVFTKDQQEFAVLEDGFTFRLDQIISVNGIPRPSNDACDFHNQK